MFRLRKPLSKTCPDFGDYLNVMIDRFPINLTFPYFNYCGPSGKTKGSFKKKPTYLLDIYCLNHDRFYEKHSDTNKRRRADIRLRNQAWKRFIAKDAVTYEKFIALFVYYGMKLKVAITKKQK